MYNGLTFLHLFPKNFISLFKIDSNNIYNLIIHFHYSKTIMFSSLPKVVEDLILDYTSQLEHVEKFQESLNRINNIEYQYFESVDGLKLSRRFVGEGRILNETVEYYHQLGYKTYQPRNDYSVVLPPSSYPILSYHFLNVEHRSNYSVNTKTGWTMNNVQVKMKRAHYGKKYILEDWGCYFE